MKEFKELAEQVKKESITPKELLYCFFVKLIDSNEYLQPLKEYASKCKQFEGDADRFIMSLTEEYIDCDYQEDPYCFCDRISDYICTAKDSEAEEFRSGTVRIEALFNRIEEWY